MQVHNYGAQQTLFAINHFNKNLEPAIGIGNDPATPSSHLDWTFNYTAKDYDYRRLHVLILPGVKPDAAPPWLINAASSHALNQISVLFSETVADDADTPSYYTLDNGITVTGAELLPNGKVVILDTSALTAGQTYTLTVNHVRDASAYANEIRLYSTFSFTAPPSTLPTVLSNIAETSKYELIHQLAVGNSVSYAEGCNYQVDQSYFTRTQTIDRIAYCMELDGDGRGYHWVYVSMDAFTSDITKIGVPTFDRATLWQTYVSNLNIYASANMENISVTTGTGIASGNIEFWPSNYGGSNNKNIPNALGVVNGTNVFDFGDSGGNTTIPGHGSMQVHNYLQSHTILSMCSFGSNGRQPCLGIGNNTDYTTAGQQDPDWTFHYNASQFTTKNIYVLAKPGDPITPTPPTGTLPELWDQPQSQKILRGWSALFTVYAPGATAWQWRKDGQLITGATAPVLEISPAEIADSGSYDVLVYGSGTAYTTSQNATLTVYPIGTVIILR